MLQLALTIFACIAARTHLPLVDSRAASVTCASMWRSFRQHLFPRYCRWHSFRQHLSTRQLKSLDLDESERFLTVPEAGSYILFAKHPNKLLIRKCYWQLAGFVEPGSSATRHVPHPGNMSSSQGSTASKYRHMLVTGMSGIGKTSWLLFLMWLLAKQDKTVVLQTVSGEFDVVNSQAAYRTSLASLELGEGVFYLVDSQICSISLARRYPTIVVSSAKRAVYKQFEKMAPTKTMPPWTREELDELRPHASSAVSEAMLSDRFSKWGGSVRYCLEANSQLSDHRLAEAIGRVDVNALLTLVRKKEANPGVDQILAHIANEDLDLDCYAFSSQYVAEEVIQLAGERAENLLLQMLDSLAFSSLAKGLRGQLFELYVLHYFLPTGGTGTIAGFDPDGNPLPSDPHTVPAHKIDNFRTLEELQTKCQARQSGTDICFVPPRGFTALDALTLPNIGLQIHVNIEHAPLSGTAISEALQVMGAPPTEQVPGKLQQWVPLDVAMHVMLGWVKGRPGGRQVPLTRQVVGVDYHCHQPAGSPP